ncbi:hypothetical protein D3C71_1795120 [compost metagenome]
MRLHQVVVNAYIRQPQAGQCCEIAVRLGVQACGHNINNLDRTTLSRPGLKQLFLAGTNRAIGELRLHHLQTFFDLNWIGAGGVSP